MISVIPLEHPISSPLQDPEKFVSNLGSKNVAPQLQEKLKEHYCLVHPDFDNQIELDMLYIKGNEFMTVKKYCCEDFKQKLELVCQNQNPFAKAVI